MAAGIATLDQLTDELYAALARRVDELERGLVEAAAGAGKQVAVGRGGPLLTLFFLPAAPVNGEQALAADRSAYARFFRAILGRGVFKAYSRRGAQLFEMMMVTLALSLIINYAIQAISHNNVYQYNVLQSSPIHIGSIIITGTQLIIVIIAIGVLAALTALLRLTKVGKALRAMAADPDLARACGIRTGRIVVLTWLLSGFLCGMAGVVYIINSQSIGYTTGQLFLPLVIAAAILGGAGSPVGAVLAALIMGIVTEAVSAFGGSAYSTVAGFAILVIVLLSRPSSVRGGQAGHTQLTL